MRIVLISTPIGFLGSGKGGGVELTLNSLAQKNILVIGFGRIGSNFVKRALAFDMNVYVYDPYVEKEKVKISGAIPVDNISENLSKMDAVTLHCPINKETTDLFTKQEFDLMKKSSFIINCARGGILNEEDLYEALKNENISGAGLDVFDVEPTPSSNPLFKLNILSNPEKPVSKETSAF